MTKQKECAGCGHVFQEGDIIRANPFKELFCEYCSDVEFDGAPTFYDLKN